MKSAWYGSKKQMHEGEHCMLGICESKERTVNQSRALQLVRAAARVSAGMSKHVAERLRRLGYVEATPSVLSFLTQLENHGAHSSAIARKLGVSRQMVAKTVKELTAAGYLQQEEVEGKKKLLHFTALGEKLMRDYRRQVADLDERLSSQVGSWSLSDTVQGLGKVQLMLNSLGGR